MKAFSGGIFFMAYSYLFKSFFKNLFRRKKAEKTIVEHIEEVTTELE